MNIIYKQTKVNYIITGEGQNTILFLHGWGGSTQSFLPLAKQYNAKCILVINVLSEHFTDPIKTNYGGIAVIQIPSLIDSNDPNKPVFKALDIIRSCLNEFAD